jgi:hypothetical protein
MCNVQTPERSCDAVAAGFAFAAPCGLVWAAEAITMKSAEVTAASKVLYRRGISFRT